MKIYKTIIIENNALEAINLKKILNDNHEDIHVVAIATTSTSAKEVLFKHKPEIVLMNIELNPSTIFDILSNIYKNFTNKFQIIFISTYERYDYIIKAIEYCASAFLIKPIDVKLLRGAIEKAKSKQNQKIQTEQLISHIQERYESNTKIIVPTANHNKVAVIIANITYFEADGTSTIIHFTDNSTLTALCMLGRFKKTLMDDYAFFLIHHSILVNVEQIKSFKARDLEITLKDDKKLYPSRRLGEGFKNYWNEFNQNKRNSFHILKNMIK